MCEVRATTARYAALDLAILVTGESGTGKELVAGELHRRSERRSGPYLAINCAAIPQTLVESELFGHVAGAFSGAKTARAGLFEQAHGGTLFLDEVGELPLEVQPKLLRVLEEGTVRRVGGNRSLPIDTRVVTATKHDLARRVREGTFRDDLYARLAQGVIRLPPLRARPEDIVTLATHFLSRTSVADTPLHAEDVAVLLAHPWPLNVRELASLIDTLPVDNPPGEPWLHLGPLAAARMAEYARLSGGDEPGRPSAERLRQLLGRHGGVVSRIAKDLGTHRQQVYRWLERHGLDPADFRR